MQKVRPSHSASFADLRSTLYALLQEGDFHTYTIQMGGGQQGVVRTNTLPNHPALLENKGGRQYVFRCAQPCTGRNDAGTLERLATPFSRTQKEPFIAALAGVGRPPQAYGVDASLHIQYAEGTPSYELRGSVPLEQLREDPLFSRLVAAL